jgi:hypothetical protein
MKTALAAALFTAAFTTVAAAQPSDCCQPQPLPQAQPQTEPLAPAPQDPAPAPAPQAQPATVAYAEPQPGAVYTGDPAIQEDDGEGWHKPVGRRFMHGFRLGWTYLFNMNKATRDTNGDDMPDQSLMKEYDLKSANMMLLGYEGFYRIVGHSWLNVLIVGNVTVAGLEQSKFIPAASGLLGFEFDRSFQLGVGVNITPDPEAPTHMIAAAGWTPRVGSINTPVHFFFVPDAERNHRMGATIGMSW